MALRRYRWWIAAAAVVTAAAGAGIAVALTRSSPAKPPALSSHTFGNPAGGLLRLDATLAAMFDTGHAPGATIVNLASVDCGPPGVRLRAGIDLECGLTASVGSAVMIVQINAPNARRFAIVEIGSELGPLTGAARAADVACHVHSRDLCAPEPPASEYPLKVLGGGTIPGPGTPGVLPCIGEPRERPNEVILACADLDSLVKHVSWSSWTTRGARGVGTLVENDCTPSCVAGRFYSYRVTIELGRAVPTYYGVLFTTYKVTADSPIRPMHSDTLSGTFPVSPN
jgi:hypothetical protein